MPNNTETNVDFVNIVGPSGMDNTPTVVSPDAYLVTGGKKQLPSDLKAQVALTAAEIKTAYESNANTNAFTDIEKTKLGNVTITQLVDLDQLETDVATNNAKVSATGSINTHSDVDGSPTDGQALAWSAANSRYQPTTISGGGGVVQSDWNATSGDAQILNKPITITTAQASAIVANSAKIGVSASSVNNVGAVMETDTTTAGMAFVIDEDDMSSNSATRIPTQQSVKAYVDANAGGTPMTKYKVLNAQFHAKPGITFTSSAGAGLLTIPNFGDISSATIPLISGTDYAANGDYILTIKWTDNSVNTWSTTSVGNIDLYVPTLKFYDIGGHIAFDTQSADSKNALAGAIDPDFDFDNGEIRFRFTNSSNFGSFPQLLCQIHFATL